MNPPAPRLAAILAIALCCQAGLARADGGAFKSAPIAQAASAAGLPPLPSLPPTSLPPADAPRQAKAADKSPGVAWPSADPRGLPPEPIQAAPASQGGYGAPAASLPIAPEGPVFTAFALDAEGGRALLGERWLRKGDKIPGRERGAIVLICRGEAVLDTGESARAGEALPAQAPKAAKGKASTKAPTCA